MRFMWGNGDDGRVGGHDDTGTVGLLNDLRVTAVFDDLVLECWEQRDIGTGATAEYVHAEEFIGGGRFVAAADPFG